jgi:N-methylhydantoinase B/oxoprolinase/acetone carboxylase alpha subunit
MIDIHTIGAGGGSIASINSAGILQVGPESAGADPGPIGYGRGGEEPTITDANLLLGRLNPAGLLGVDGAAPLDRIRDIFSKDEDLRVVAGDTVAVRTPGGGGYGDPWQRDPALVARDVARGYLTAEDSERDYGVVLTAGDPPVVDRRGTDEFRRRGRP